MQMLEIVLFQTVALNNHVEVMETYHCGVYEKHKWSCCNNSQRQSWGCRLTRARESTLNICNYCSHWGSCKRLEITSFCVQPFTQVEQGHIQQQSLPVNMKEQAPLRKKVGGVYPITLLTCSIGFPLTDSTSESPTFVQSYVLSQSFPGHYSRSYEPFNILEEISETASFKK